jgi:GT2 family glycosyltransferase
VESQTTARVSVVIPVLNGGRWLAHQLRALEVDGAQPFETVIADNGSTDDSISIARSFGREMTIVVVDASGRRGQTFARNLGARTATGDSLLFLDQDDEIGPGYVTSMASALGRAELVAARMDGDKLNDGWRRHARTLPQTSGLPTDPVPWAYGCTLGVRRSTFERLGGFAEDLGALAGEDVDFCWRAHENDVELTFVRDAVLHYRYPTTISGFFRQGITYGFAGVIVEARHGRVPSMTRSELIRSFAGPMRLLVLGPSSGARASAFFLLGRRLGRVRGLRQLRRPAFSSGVSTEPR